LPNKGKLLIPRSGLRTTQYLGIAHLISQPSPSHTVGLELSEDCFSGLKHGGVSIPHSGLRTICG